MALRESKSSSGHNSKNTTTRKGYHVPFFAQVVPCEIVGGLFVSPNTYSGTLRNLLHLLFCDSYTVNVQARWD